eukprot:18795-Heterococcus_DN1.PRE.4
MSAKWDRNAGTASPHRKLRRKWAKKPERQLNHCARALVQKSKAVLQRNNSTTASSSSYDAAVNDSIMLSVAGTSSIGISSVVLP